MFLQIGHGKLNKEERDSFVMVHRARSNSKGRTPPLTADNSYTSLNDSDELESTPTEKLLLEEEEYSVAN